MSSSNHQKVKVIVGVIYVFMLLYILFLAPFRTDTNTDVNLIPFKSLIEMIKPFFVAPGQSWEYVLHVFLNIGGNIFLLLPFPILFHIKLRGWSKWALIIFLPAGIELMQYFTQLGAANVDDVIYNASGFALGFWMRKKGF